jgi:glycosyltransferase involved in cell wall biosynthesis
MKTFYIRVNRSIAAIHALNTTDYKIIKYLGFNCYYTPLGVDTSLFKPRRRNSKFTVVFTGARFGKGADMLSRIIPMVLRKAPDTKFVLARASATRDFLTKYFALLKDTFKNNVETYDFLPQEEFTKLLSTSHVFLFLSRYESFGLAALEALSCGVPVVCFKIAGVPKDVVLARKAGTVVEPFAIDKIVKAIVDYYGMWKNNISEFDRLSVECRNVALKFDWSIIVELFDHMFKDASKLG